MIDWLEVKQFAIADHIEIEFDDRFTTVTGETGSGKSLIVDAIDILLGHRSDSSYIRHDQDTAELQAGFELTSGHPALRWLEDQGISNEDECILRRVIRRNKSSKGYINGHAVTVSQLRDLGKELVDIHGQNEHHSLLKRPVQQQLLDSSANNTQLIAELGDRYQSITEIRKQIDVLQNESHVAQERADLLKFQIEELNELAPQPDEWSELDNTHKKLNHQQELVVGTQAVAELLYDGDDENISDQLIQSSQQLTQLSEFDDNLKSVSKMLDESQVIIEEAANQLRSYYQDSDIDPEEMQQIEKRFSLYYTLARKHRLHPDKLAEHLESMKLQLEGLKDPESELIRLNELLESESETYQKIAGEISTNRKKVSKSLGADVTGLMQELGMQGGEFAIRLNPNPVEEDSFTRYGNETVEFVVTANPGQPLQNLAKIASGGEISRISLAIQVILANKAQVPTLIFDEVDVGIGGEVANVVGQKLKHLGRTSQVICVTHLSQVAAKGDHHFSVSKIGEKQVAVTVMKLNAEQRVKEIARMSGGENITEQSLAHAQEMLKSA